MKRSHDVAFTDAVAVLLAVAQHMPHVPATVPAAALLRTLSRTLRANAPQWPVVTGRRDLLYFPCIPLVFGECAEDEHMPLMQWVIANNKLLRPLQEFIWFAVHGMINVVNLLAKVFPDERCISSAAASAADAGKWEVVRFLVEHWNCVGFEVAHKSAAKGQLDILQLISQKAGIFHRHSCIIQVAAVNGRLNILEWLIAEGYPLTQDVIFAVVERGLFHVVDWFLRHDYQLPARAYEYAIWSRHIDCDVSVLEKLHSRNCPWNELTCAAAARGGNFPALKWLREHGCPWDQNTTYYAAECGKVEMLDWAIANGCPRNLENIIDAAIRRGELKMLQWAIDHGWIVTQRHIDTLEDRVLMMNLFRVAEFLRLKMQEQQSKTRKPL